MTVGSALRAALRDLYQQSWRLVILNGALSAVALAIAAAALWAPPVIVLAVVVGPLALGFMHCAVTLAQTEELRLRDAIDGVRLHWRRGLALDVLAGGVIAAGVFALAFYARSGPLGLTLAILVLYVLCLFGVFQVVLWPLAVFERSTPLGVVCRHAALSVLGRPLEAIVLGLALLIVNLAGVVAALVPFLTLTIAYSFLAAAHFALPPSPLREAHA